MDAIDNINGRFFRSLCDGLRKEDGQKAREFGRYPYIAADNERADVTFSLVKSLLTAHWKGSLIARPETPSFLDAGCGIGVKVYLASAIGFKARGVELCERSIQIAPIALGEKAIIRGNLLTYKGYNKFDAVYLYCPMTNPKLQMEFEERLVRLSKPDVFIISALDSHKLGDKLTEIKPNSELVTKMLNSVCLARPKEDNEDPYYGRYFKIYVKPMFYKVLEERFL